MSLVWSLQACASSAPSPYTAIICKSIYFVLRCCQVLSKSPLWKIDALRVRKNDTGNGLVRRVSLLSLLKLQRCTPRRANFYGLVVAFTNLTPCYGTLLLFHLKQHSDQMQIKFTQWKNQFSERERKAVTRFHADVSLTSEFASVDFVTQ